MKKTLTGLFLILTLCVFTHAQSTATLAQSSQTAETKAKKTVFRANKEQILQAQKILKVTESGKLSSEDKLALKAYQKENGLRASGSLNRATLEKMGIAMTAKQREIPVDPKSFASAAKDTPRSGKPVFKATKDQVMQAQKIINTKESGKLSDEDRESLKKYQTENGLKATGTLNKTTLEKMGIALTDKQKQM